ncbi:MAG: transketolase family protein [Bacillota bacterium]
MSDLANLPAEATRSAYGRVLVQLGEEREDIVVLDADLSGSTRTSQFAARFPERFFNMGIAEQNMMNVAAGLALGGKIPFASTFAIFATGRAWEQIRNSVAYPQLPVRIVATHAGITVGPDGASHQALEDIALMRVIPGMTVIVPADAPETERAIRAVVDLDGPVYVRLGRAEVPVLSDGGDFVPGRARVLRPGKDVALVACGIMVSRALEAAERLESAGVDARVINLSTIKPLDVGVLTAAAEECGAVVTAEEHSVIGGAGSAVAELLGEVHPVPVLRVGVTDRFGQSGEADELLEAYGLTAAAIEEAALRAVRCKR